MVGGANPDNKCVSPKSVPGGRAHAGARHASNNATRHTHTPGNTRPRTTSTSSTRPQTATPKAAAKKDSAAVAKKKARIKQQVTVHGYVNTTPYQNMPSTSLDNGGSVPGSGDAPLAPSMDSHVAAPAQTYTAKKTKHRTKKKRGPKRTGTVMIFKDEPTPTPKQPPPASTEPADLYSMSNSEYEPADPYSMSNSEYAPADPYSMANSEYELMRPDSDSAVEHDSDPAVRMENSEYELMIPESGSATEHDSDPAVHTYVNVPTTGSSDSATGSSDLASGHQQAVLNGALYESTAQQQSAVQTRTLYSATPAQQGQHAPDLAGLGHCVCGRVRV